MGKFKNKYRIESNRLRGWDYSSDTMYFITILTGHRDCIFGKIENGKMVYNEFGTIADKEWLSSFKTRKELFLDEYIIMPNHIHAIVVIEKNKQTKNMGYTAAQPSSVTQPPKPRHPGFNGNQNQYHLSSPGINRRSSTKLTISLTIIN